MKKLRDGEALLNVGKDLATVWRALEISEATFNRRRNQYGGMKSEEAKRLKALENENRRLKRIVADKELDIQMRKHLASKTGEPFGPACGDGGSAGAVPGLGAKGVRGAGAAAGHAAVPETSPE